MPEFPGMGYPLVPGYEAVGRVIEAGSGSNFVEGTRVFVPGGHCFEGVRSLFGGAAARLIVPASRAIPVKEDLGASATLLALAATAHHIAPIGEGSAPELIVGHGVLGRLLARLTLLGGGPPPVVWETDATRRDDSQGYVVLDPSQDFRRDYTCVCDVSGSSDIVDLLIERLAPRGELILAGFYERPLSIAFPPAFMREARLRVAAQWQPTDLAAVSRLVDEGRLSLAGLLTHEATADQAAAAYAQAFEDKACLKMVLNWRGLPS
jgi:3-hydroxyethyl bacteriochlorophyllide a dehydrogenase